MSLLPVFIRELRSQARQPMTYWLRIVGGLSVACAIAIALWTMYRTMNQWQTLLSLSGARGRGFPNLAAPNPILAFGTALFGKMNLFIFLAIWIFVPLASADAISRERREGTLPLLYLTELRSLGIVVGKAFVHLLRSLSLFLAMAPWLMLPLVFGSVSLREIKTALLLDFASVLLAQAAGLLASTFPRDWLKAAILAEVFALFLFLMMLHFHTGILGRAVLVSIPPTVTPGTPAFWNSSFANLGEFYYNQGGLLARTARSIELATNASLRERDDWSFSSNGGEQRSWQEISSCLTPAGQRVWSAGITGLVAASAVVLCLAAWLGAWRIDRSWRDSPAPVWLSDLRHRLFSPRFAVPLLHRRLSRSLTANPIGWLQHYSPSARLVKYAWCGFIILIEIILSDNVADLYTAQSWLGLVLLLGLTFSATGSFRHELETGAFELWLVTPLREGQIIAGRVRGLWRQFLPAVVLFAGGSVYLASGWSGNNYAGLAWLNLARTMTGFCALPFIGLYFSIRRWNFFAAWLAACLVGLLPAALGRAFEVPEIFLIVLQVIVALTAFGLLFGRLRTRRFLHRRT
jgi:ABC-type transport system involved in multi-copper enzyme maturation permease subunit